MPAAKGYSALILRSLAPTRMFAEGHLTDKEPDMNAIWISFVAIIITAALAMIAPIAHYSAHRVDNAGPSAHCMATAACARSRA